MNEKIVFNLGTITEIKFYFEDWYLILAKEVLFKALEDCFSEDEAYKKGNVYINAYNWIYSDEELEEDDISRFTFNEICRILDLDKTKVRILLERYIDLGYVNRGKKSFNAERKKSFMEAVKNDE